MADSLCLLTDSVLWCLVTTSAKAVSNSVKDLLFNTGLQPYLPQPEHVRESRACTPSDSALTDLLRSQGSTLNMSPDLETLRGLWRAGALLPDRPERSSVGNDLWL